MQRIVFVGNCQVQAIYGLFRTFAQDRREHELFYVAAYEELDNAGIAAISKADLIVEQVFDMPPKAEIAGLNSRSRRILVPLVGCNFLWPFAGSPHPQNPTRPFLPGGPFPGEAGVSFLNRMLRDGVDPETAVEAFMDLDVPKHIKLDRLFEISIDRQRRRDEMTGYDFATLIERHYRDERLFLTTYHPDRRIAIELASICFERIGVDPADIARMRRLTRVTPFPKDELPVHPAVAQHFGLSYLPVEPRFRYLHCSPLSFRDFALNYMRCEWNEPLEEGLALVKQDKMTEAEPRLLEGLARDPKAALGYAGLGVARQALGRVDEAIEPLMKAVMVDPENETIWVQAGAAMRAIGDLDGAEAAFRRAVALEPADAHLTATLVHLLRGRGKSADAAAVLRDGLRVDDRSAKLHLETAYLAEHENNWDTAARHYRAALRCDASLPLQAALIKALNKAGRTAEAADFQRNSGLSDAMEPAAHTAEVRTGDDIDQQLTLGNELFQAGQMEAAAAAYQVVCDRRPETYFAWLRLGETKLRLGNPVAAEQALCAALALDESTRVYQLLASALGEQARFAEAASFCRAIVHREPDVPLWHAQLGSALMRAGDMDAAVTALRQAVERDAGNPRFRIELSHALRHSGQLSEAVLVARAAVELAPDQTSYRANLAQMLSENNDLEESVTVWEEVCTSSPENAQFRERLTAVRNRAPYKAR
jgi:tetratricopeptide (TPR) repeat protein